MPEERINWTMVAVHSACWIVVIFGIMCGLVVLYGASKNLE